MLRRLLVLTAAVIPLLAADTPRLPEPSKLPAPRSPAHRKLALEGVQLHDTGDYEGAIRRFEQILEENPDDVGALYELSYSLMASGHYRRSLDVAMRAAEYNSELLSYTYGVIGSDLDELGDQKGAVAVYTEGMRRFPGNAMLPFNLGITYLRMGRRVDARRMYQAALWADPSHASSHYRLGGLYIEDGYEVPGILALLRFLEVAQDTQRSRRALEVVSARLLGAAQAGSKPNEINVTINFAGNSKTDEGDFTGPAAMIGLGAALRFTDEGKELNKAQTLLRQHEMLFESLDGKDLRKEKKKFGAAFYAAYFRELHKAHHTEAFSYFALRQSGWPEVEDWLGKNDAKVKSYTEWAQAYAWPQDPKKKRKK